MDKKKKQKYKEKLINKQKYPIEDIKSSMDKYLSKNTDIPEKIFLERINHLSKDKNNGKKNKKMIIKLLTFFYFQF